MPQVQSYNQQIAPTVRPVVDIPQGAFGADVAAANAQLGNTLQNVGQQLDDRLYQMQLQKDNQTVLDAETAYRKDMNDLLYNQDTGIMIRTLNNAEGAYSEYDKKAKELQQKYTQGLKSPDMKNMFGKLANEHYISGQSQVLQHEVQQTRAGQELSYKNNVSMNADDAAKNPTQDNVMRLMGDTYGKADVFFKGMGFNADEIATKKQEAANLIMISAVKSALAKNDVPGAKALYEKFKGQMSGDAATGLSEQVKDSAIYYDGNQIFNSVLSQKGMIQSDGFVDQQKLTDSAREELKKSGYTEGDIEKGINYIQEKGREKDRQLIQHRNEVDRTFTNSAVDSYKSGRTYSQTLLLAKQFGYDSTDIYAKEEYIRQLYGISKYGSGTTGKSNSSVYIQLWEGIRNKTVSQKDINAAFNNGLLSSSDWESLRKDVFNEQTKGQTDMDKAVYDFFKMRTKAHFGSNTKDMNEFLYLMKPQLQGKTLDQAQTLLDNSFKKVENGDYKFEWLVGKNWGQYHSEQWKTQIKFRDETNQQWGKNYNLLGNGDVSLGRELSLAIGMSNKITTGKKDITINDINDFIGQLGGYDKLKQGDKTMKAIQWLYDKGQLITVENVKHVLSDPKLLTSNQ